MDPIIILYSIAFAALVVGSYTDFKVREVPDWLNYGLIFIGIGLRAIFSAVNNDSSYIVQGILGLGVFLGLALIMFYAGQWGGGDAKMLMGLGALFGLQIKINTFMLGFVVNTLLCGAVFGLLFSAYLAIRKREEFKFEFIKLYIDKRKKKLLAWTATAIVILASIWVDSYLRLLLFIIAGLIFLSFYIFVFLHAVENCCMIKEVHPDKLTEGDWIVNDIVVDGKRITGPKDLGVSIEQIDKLKELKAKKKIDLVMIKEGIPFVPSFLLGFLVNILWGNWILEMVGII
jgi:Flp pilus assembly protein protease CpaA